MCGFLGISLVLLAISILINVRHVRRFYRLNRLVHCGWRLEPKDSDSVHERIAYYPPNSTVEHTSINTAYNISKLCKSYGITPEQIHGTARATTPETWRLDD
jgi:hypothetical protein